jgi:hypothetical protein
VQNVVDGAVDEDKLGDVMFYEMEVPPVSKRGDVFDAAGDEIVQTDHLVPLAQQILAEVGT